VPDAITSYDGLLVRLGSLPSSGASPEAAIVKVLAEAAAAGLRLSETELQQLFVEYGAAFDGGAVDRARTFIGVAGRLLPADAPQGQRLLDLLTTTRTSDVRSSSPAFDALGFDPQTGTIQRLRKANAVIAAKQCGPVLTVHTEIYRAFLQESVLRNLRVHTADYLKARNDEHAFSAPSLERATSASAVAELLERTPHLAAALEYAATMALEPVKQVLADVAGLPPEELARAVRRLDSVDVAIVDIDGTAKIDERDILAFEVGRTSFVAPLGCELADRLRLSACIQRAIAVVGDFGGCRLGFASGAFRGPEVHFKVEPSCFKLRHEKLPDLPWLTRAKSASAALDHVKNNMEAYVMHCAAAIATAWFFGRYYEINELAGDRGREIFDQVNPHMVIGKWDHHWSNALVHREIAIDPRLDVPMPGESRYFKTADVSPAGKLGGWQGENVLFYKVAGDRDFGWNKGDWIWFGHPFGLATEQEILQVLDANRFGLNPDGIPALASARAALDRVAAGLPALGSLARSAEHLSSEANRYTIKRGEYETFMKKYLRTYMGARDAVNRPRPDPTAAPEVVAAYDEAKKTYEELRHEIDTYDREVARLAESAGRVNVEALVAAKALAKGSWPADVTETLTRLIAVLRGLEPNASSLHTEGRVLEPYRAFQERDKMNPRLL
jgi:hypothetical protein